MRRRVQRCRATHLRAELIRKHCCLTAKPVSECKNVTMAKASTAFRVLFVCVLLEASRTATAFEEHIVSEVDVNGTVGQRIVLPCTPYINVSVRWLYQPSESSEADEIYFNSFIMNGHRQHFEVLSASSGNYALVVKEALLANSGVYTCWEENGQGDQHIVHLAVTKVHDTATAMRSSSTTTKTEVLIRGNAVTETSQGSETKTAANTALTVTVLITVIVLVTAVIVIVVVLVLIVRRGKHACFHETPFSRCCKSQYGGADGTPLLKGQTWQSIIDLEQEVYNTRKNNPKEWTNNRFVAGVAREPKMFSKFVEHLKSLVRRRRVQAIVGINSADCRGELIAAPLACNLKIPYISVSATATHKPSDDVETETFVSTKGETVTLEVAADRKLNGKVVVIIDSFYSTGHSSDAAKKLVEHALGATVVETIVFTSVAAVPKDRGIRAIFSHDKDEAQT